MSTIRWGIPLACLVGIVVLNCIPHQDSRAFEQNSFPDAFGVSYGFPVNCVASANDEGVALVNDSVVFGGTSVFKNVSGGQFPHLAVNGGLVALSVFVAVVILGISVLIGRLTSIRRN